MTACKRCHGDGFTECRCVTEAVDVVGQPDPVLLDAARRAGEVLSELVRVESALEVTVANVDRADRRQIVGIVAHLAELRAKLRPVASLDIDARERALADERETSARVEVARIGERKPSAGWVEGDGALPGDIMLHVGRCIAAAGPGGSWVVTMLAKSVDGAPAMTVVAQGKASSRLAAQLAAEDALLAIAAEIVGAVGR